MLRGKPITQRLPLFPHYVFVMFDKDNDVWQKINKAKGIKRLIGCDERYVTPLPEGCVEELKSRMDLTGNVPLESSINAILDFTPKMKLEITDGPFAGNIATYCNHSGNRVSLLFTLLNRQIKVELPINSIKPLPDGTDGVPLKSTGS